MRNMLQQQKNLASMGSRHYLSTAPQPLLMRSMLQQQKNLASMGSRRYEATAPQPLLMRSMLQQQRNLASMGNRRYGATARQPVYLSDASLPPLKPLAAPAPLPTLPEQNIEVLHPEWPQKVLGLYILLADDSEEGFESNADWNPELFDWQQEASNVLFF